MGGFGSKAEGGGSLQHKDYGSVGCIIGDDSFWKPLHVFMYFLFLLVSFIS